jgi:hypothetical protein
MIFSRPLLGTDTKKIKMSWMEYIFTHLVPTWFNSFNENFVMWRDLITENYKPYKLLKSDNAEQECYDWFWSSINLDETYPKEFLEYLMEMAEDVRTGKVETVPLTEDFFDRLKDLVGDMEDLEDTSE